MKELNPIERAYQEALQRGELEMGLGSFQEFIREGRVQEGDLIGMVWREDLMRKLLGSRGHVLEDGKWVKQTDFLVMNEGELCYLSDLVKGAETFGITVLKYGFLDGHPALLYPPCDQLVPHYYSVEDHFELKGYSGRPISEALENARLIKLGTQDKNEIVWEKAISAWRDTCREILMWDD